MDKVANKMKEAVPKVLERAYSKGIRVKLDQLPGDVQAAALQVRTGKAQLPSNS